MNIIYTYIYIYIYINIAIQKTYINNSFVFYWVSNPFVFLYSESLVITNILLKWSGLFNQFPFCIFKLISMIINHYAHCFIILLYFLFIYFLIFSCLLCFSLLHTHQELLSQGYVMTPTVAWFPLSSVLLSFWENKFIASNSKFYFGLQIVLLLS